jgi:hypothetical protein
MIAVLIWHRRPPTVIEASAEEICWMTVDPTATGSHTKSVPPGSFVSVFEKAWSIFTKDMLEARHFATLEEAHGFYRFKPAGLSIHHHTLVLTGLQKLKKKQESARPKEALQIG